jgi:hypothetical protein
MSQQNYRQYKQLPEGWISYQPKDGEEPPEAPKWSGDKAPPAVGDKVRISMNGIGPAIVRGYFVEYGWLGVLTEVLNPPKWWVEQNVKPGKPAPLGHAFGVEIKY